MSNIALAFLAGIVVGNMTGILVLGLCAMARRSGEDIERQMNNDVG